MTPPACAVVVTYHPDAGFPARLAAALGGCERAVVVDNGSNPSALETVRTAADSRVQLIENGTNRGLAAALNQGVRAAADLGFAWAVTLDQDTRPLPEMTSALFAALAAHPSPSRVGLVGSAPVDAAGRRVYPGGGGAFVPVPYAVTAGSLTSIPWWRRVGGFREELFIDSVDRDYCYRLRSAGGHVIRAVAPGIVHGWGEPVRVRVGPVGVVCSNHSARRRYLITRNWCAALVRAGRLAPGLLPAEAFSFGIDTVKAVLLEPDRGRKAAAVARGLADAVRGRLGPPP